MTRLWTFTIALICVGLGAAFWVGLPQSSSRAQPPAKQPSAQDAQSAQTQIAELREKLNKLNQESYELRDLPREEKADSGDQPKIAKELSKKEIEERQRRLKAIEAEKAQTLAALVAALKAAPNFTTRDDNAVMMRILQQPIDTRGFQDKIKLKTALGFLWDQWHGLLPIIVDKEAFLEGNPDAPDPYEEEVSLPPIPAKMLTGAALRLLVAQVGRGEGVFQIRQGYIEITTQKFKTTAHAFLNSSVSANFEQRPFQDVLKDLTAETGLQIHVDPNIGKKADMPITANFRNNSLEDALVAVTEMAELKFVALHDSIYVTTPNRVEAIEKEEAKRAERRRQSIKAKTVAVK